MQVRRIVDLSVPIGPDTQVYPGDPQPELTPHATLHRDGENSMNTIVTLVTRAGSLAVSARPLPNANGGTP